MGQMPIGVLYRGHTPPEQLPAYARLVERLGYDELADELAALLAATPGVAALAAALPERFLERFAAAGTAEQCAAAVARLRDASADAVVLVPPRDAPSAVAQLTLAAESLLPMLRAATG
jgi:hypothetical protein